MASLSQKIILTLAKGEQRIPLDRLKQDYTPTEYKEQCEVLILNKSVSYEDGMIFMTQKQRQNAHLIYNI